MTNLPAERLMSRTACFRTLLDERWLGQRRRGHVVDLVGPVVLVLANALVGRAARRVRVVQHGVGDGAEQRVETLHVADQVQVQRAGLDALYHLLVQAVDMGMGVAPFLQAEALLGPAQALGAVEVAVEEH